MSTNHWFVDAVSEMVEDANRNSQRHVLCGLRTALLIFMDETGLTQEDKVLVERLIHEDAFSTLKADCAV